MHKNNMAKITGTVITEPQNHSMIMKLQEHYFTEQS